VATPYPITPQLLKRGIVHVCYEYANLISAAHCDIHGAAPWRTHCDDAFLLGYRKMRDFLLKGKRTARNGAELPDILATDYLPAGTILTWTLPTWETEWQAEMDKQLAHITFEREKEWNHLKWVPTLEREMREAWTKFIDALDAQTKADFVAEIAMCQKKPGFSGVKL
jgi:hypothetical protein